MRYTAPILTASLANTIAAFACSELANPTKPNMEPSPGKPPRSSVASACPMA
jgi:hypothetical protein